MTEFMLQSSYETFAKKEERVWIAIASTCSISCYTSQKAWFEIIFKVMKVIAISPDPFPLTCQRIFKPAFTAAMDRAWDLWWSDATRLATSFCRCNPMWFLSMGLCQGSGLTVRYVTKTWSVVLLNKKYIYSYLKCIVYDKSLKPRQSFWITLYLLILVQHSMWRRLRIWVKVHVSCSLTHFYEHNVTTFSLTFIHNKLNKIIHMGFEASANGAADDSIFLGWHCIISQENGFFKIILYLIDSNTLLS